VKVYVADAPISAKFLWVEDLPNKARSVLDLIEETAKMPVSVK